MTDFIFFFFQIFRSPTSNEEINQLAYQCVPSFQIDFGRFCIHLCAKIVKMLFLLHKIYVFLKKMEKINTVQNVTCLLLNRTTLPHEKLS